MACDKFDTVVRISGRSNCYRVRVSVLRTFTMITPDSRCAEEPVVMRMDFEVEAGDFLLEVSSLV